MVGIRHAPTPKEIRQIPSATETPPTIATQLEEEILRTPPATIEEVAAGDQGPLEDI
jgi:hypothetical protein